MPCFRGVDLSIILQPGSETLPEFPHPEASSVRVLPLSLAVHASPGSPGTFGPSSATSSPRLQKANARISVYIPSVPSSQFCINYSVVRTPEPACYVFFKLFINGRNITNWGINPAQQASGSVTRALYEPGERWQYEEDGIIYRKAGIESRTFHFAPEKATSSVADDGGLIEVQVFRAKGRRRRSPRLDQYRNQDRYGFTSPSNGLLECPEDTSYFDWILVDSKDSPFASFRFHYRGWENLRQLNLVCPRQSFDEVASRLSVSYSGSPLAPEEFSFADTDEKSFEQQLQLQDEGVFEPSLADVSYSSFGEPSWAYSLKAPPLLRRRPSRDRQPSYRSGIGDATPRKSSDSSAVSIAPSIAPSLLPYVEDGTVGSDDFEYGTAVRLTIGTNSLVPSPLRRALPEVPKAPASKEAKLPADSKQGSLPGLGDICICHDKSPESSVNVARQMSCPPTPAEDNCTKSMLRCEDHVTNEPLEQELLLASAVNALSLSESEWMKRPTSSASILTVIQEI